MIALLPFLPYIIAAVASLAGLGANWWLDLTDWQTAVTVAVATLACVFVSTTGSPWSRLIISAIIGGALYIKGGIDKEARLLVEYEAEKVQIHNSYAAAHDAEQRRQRLANQAAQLAAEKAREQHDAELASLREQLSNAAAMAANDPHAKQPSLSLDAVRRLNAVRLRQQPGT